MEWASWFEDFNNRRVALWEFGPLRVSTVFLGLDHNFFRSGPPLVFETMAFLGGAELLQTRCATWMEAEEQHREALAYTRTFAWRHPIELIKAIGDMLRLWMRLWDERFLARYNKRLDFMEDSW